MATATRSKQENKQDSTDAGAPVVTEGPRSKTRYRVFLQNEDGAWASVTEVEALNDIKAIQSVVADRSYDLGGTFLAIPSRSYKPRTVALETPAPRVRVS